MHFNGTQDLDDQLDAADEELSFLEAELTTAERASLKGEGSAALELRRRIAGAHFEACARHSAIPLLFALHCVCMCVCVCVCLGEGGRVWMWVHTFNLPATC
jgi:hypothetical protein